MIPRTITKLNKRNWSITMNKYNNHYLKGKNWSSENTIRDTCSRYIGADFFVPIYKLNQIMHKVEITWISVIFFYFNISPTWSSWRRHYFFKSMFDFHTNLHITYIIKINNRSNQERQNGWPAVKYRSICILIKYEEKMRLQNSRYLQRLLKSTG